MLDGTIWSPLIRILTICASNENLETRFLIVWNIFCSWKIFIECLNAQQSKTKGVLPLERWFSRRTLARLEVSCVLTSSYKTLVSKLWLPKVNFCRIGDLLVVISDSVRVLFDWVLWNKSNDKNQSEERKNTFKSQWKLGVKTNKQPKRRETRATESWLVLVLHLIGWESDASYLDQSQSEVKQYQNNPMLLSIQLHLDRPRGQFAYRRKLFETKPLTEAQLDSFWRIFVTWNKLWMFFFLLYFIFFSLVFHIRLQWWRL